MPHRQRHTQWFPDQYDTKSYSIIFGLLTLRTFDPSDKWTVTSIIYVWHPAAIFDCSERYNHRYGYQYAIYNRDSVDRSIANNRSRIRVFILLLFGARNVHKVPYFFQGKLGELLLSLCYDSSIGAITVEITEARGLRAMDINGYSGQLYIFMIFRLHTHNISPAHRNKFVLISFYWIYEGFPHKMSHL